MLPCGVYNTKYAQEVAVIRTKLQWGLFISSLIFIFTFPLYASGYFIGLFNYLAITIINVLGLMLVTGYCGQVSFGQAAFMAVGAYSSAIFTGKFGLPFWLALPLSGLTAGMVGLIGGAPSLRIKGFYLALATLAMHFLIMWIVIRLEITGTTFGLSVPPPKIGGLIFDTDKEMYFIIMPVMIIMTFFAKNIVRSKTGRAFVAIRDNDLAAELLGINVFRYKLLAFFISTFYAGVAGSLWAHLMQIVHPEQFTLWHAIMYLGMIIIGGLGTIVGVFFGVLFLRILDEMVLFLSPTLTEIFPALGVHPAASLSLTLFGVVLIIFLLFEPRGIAHRWEIFKAYYRLHPFAYI